MDKYDLECDDILQAEQCSNRLFDKMGIDKDRVNKAVANSVVDGIILEKNKKFLEGGGVVTYPSVSINNLRLPGNLKV